EGSASAIFSPSTVIVTRAASKPGTAVRSTIPLYSPSGGVSRVRTSWVFALAAVVRKLRIRPRTILMWRLLQITRCVFIDPPVLEAIPGNGFDVEPRLGVRNRFYE